MAERASEFPENSTGWAKRWEVEIAAAEKFIKDFWSQGDKVNKAFLDERKDDQLGDFTTKLNLFNSNIITLQSMLYGRIPKVEVDRRFADQNDDVARVAGLILQRILNTDIEDAGEDYSSVLRSALQDRLLCGMGAARIKYDFESSMVSTPPITNEFGEVVAEGYEEERIEDEWVDTLYVHWRDLLWSPCRTFAELRWRAYAVYMYRDELIARFGKEVGELIPLNSKGPLNPDLKDGTAKTEEVWQQAKVWEIWDKTSKKVFWYVKGFDHILDVKEDPLQLEGFFPEPPPMMANLTTNKYLAKSDYIIAMDLYNEINILQTRIDLLTEACKVVGVYDKGNDGVQRVLMEGVENQLIPVDNWAGFAEKGGLKGVIDWVPIEQIAKVIDILSAKQAEKINQLYQITGMSDILRGASTMQASATEQAIKAKFASIRVQALQDEFARFASDLCRLKAEVIAKHYQEYCILQQSNIEMTPDAHLAPQAVQLIKDPKSARWKITVKPETLAMVDYAQLKQDRTEYINALAVFLQSAAPLVEMDPQAVAPLMEMLKWGLAGFKGSQEIEGVLDRAISMFEKKAQNPNNKPDPEQIKAQAEIQKAQLDLQQSQEEHQFKMQEMQMEFNLKMTEMQKKHEVEMAKIRMEMIQTFQEQRAQTEGAVTEAVVDGAVQKEVGVGPKGKGAGGSNGSKK